MKRITALLAISILLATNAFAQEPSINVKAEGPDGAEKSVEAKPAKALTLYNFKTEMDEDIADPHNMSVEKGKEFIPPLPVAEQLYLNYIDQGATSLEAITFTYVELRKAMNEVEASE